jgi:hypothetical protein
MGEIVIKGDTALALANGNMGVNDVPARISAIMTRHGARPEDFRTILFFNGRPMIFGKTFRIDCDSSLIPERSKFRALRSTFSYFGKSISN